MYEQCNILSLMCSHFSSHIFCQCCSSSVRSFLKFLSSINTEPNMKHIGPDLASGLRPLLGWFKLQKDWIKKSISFSDVLLFGWPKEQSRSSPSHGELLSARSNQEAECVHVPYHSFQKHSFSDPSVAVGPWPLV